MLLPQRQAQTQEFWKTLKNFKACISEVTIKEINNNPNIRKRDKLLKLTANLTVLFITYKIKKLAQEYLKKEIIPVKYIMMLCICQLRRFINAICWLVGIVNI